MNKMYRKIVIGVLSFIALLSLKNSCYAQQDFQYTQYMYNTVGINPAYAGSRGVLSLSSIYKNQWVGLDGAPTTIQFSAHAPIYSERIGLGFSVSNDAIGPSTETTATADFSYTIRLSRKTKLAFGLKAGWNFYNVDYNKLDIDDPTELLGEESLSTNAPTFGFGTYFYGDNWYAGISIPNTFESKHYDDYTVTIASEKAHLYIIGGYVFDINRDWTFKPATMIKGVSGAPISFDISANFLYRDNLSFGVSYRWNNTISALAGFQISKSIMLGYAYDYDITELGRYNHSSHEFFLRFELFSGRNLVNPRFF